MRELRDDTNFALRQFCQFENTVSPEWQMQLRAVQDAMLGIPVFG